MITGLSRHWWYILTANDNNFWPHRPDQETACPSKGPLDKHPANRFKGSGNQLLFTSNTNRGPVMDLVLDANRNESLRVRMTQAASLLLMQLVYRTSRSSSSIPSC